MSDTGDMYGAPDLASLQPADIELPTEFQDDKLTLSGLISQFSGVEETQSFKVDPGTVAGQEETLEIILQPYNHTVDDIQSIMNGFGNTEPITLMSPRNSQDGSGLYGEPWVEILEQPKSNSLRFRYECEGKGAGALQGKFSTQDHKTFPKIKVHGFKGFATVVVSCVTHNHDPPKSHPHNLVSPASVPNGCKYGICTQVINPETMTAEFPHLGIQCVKRKDIKRSLDTRKDKKVDPFRQGWKHIDSPQNIDLNAVKLCFHVWYEADVKGKCTRPMKPVCSDIIYDAKAKKELQICDISDTCSTVLGDKKIIILCEKVSRDDIRIRFYDEEGWEAFGVFAPSDVHKQYAISFHPAKYKDLKIKEKRRVQVELCKSNGETSEPQDFFYLPAEGTFGQDVRTTGFADKGLKKEIKVEDSNIHLKVQQISTRATKSAYSHVQIGQSGAFVLAEKPSMDMHSDFSLSNIQPTFNLAQESRQIENLLNLEHLPSMNSSMTGMSMISPAPILPHRPSTMEMSPMSNISEAMSDIAGSFSPYSPEMPNSNLTFQNMDDPGQLIYSQTTAIASGLDDYYSLGAGDESVNSLSETITQNMSLQPERAAGKRSQKDANLESGSMVLPYQQSRTDHDHTAKPNLSRQLSSLNTPTVSEQLSSNSSMNIFAANLAGGALNHF